MPMIDEDGQLNNRAKTVFTEIFYRYAIKDPDDETRHIMTFNQVETYVIGATGQSMVKGGVT